MKHAILIGATGLIGTHLLQKLSSDTAYQSIRALVRKIPDQKMPGVDYCPYDFNQPDPNQVRADVLFCCLGTTIKQAGSQEAFRKVDFTYIVETARIARENGVAQIVLVSAMGADSRSRIFYNRIKGETEDAIQRMDFPSAYILQPSLLLGNRTEYRAGERISARLMTAFSFLIPKNYRAIHAETVALGMMGAAREAKPGMHIIRNQDIPKLGGQQ